MDAEDDAGPRRLRRRRRGNTRAGARSVEQKVRLTAGELDQLRERAAAAGVTVPRLMVEAAFADGAQTAADYRVIGMELLSAQTTVGRAADNMNQIARKANTVHEVPSSFGPAIAEMRASVALMSDAIDALVAVVRGSAGDSDRELGREPVAGGAGGDQGAGRAYGSDVEKDVAQ